MSKTKQQIYCGVTEGIWATFASNLTESLHYGHGAAKVGDIKAMLRNIERIGMSCREALERLKEESEI